MTKQPKNSIKIRVRNKMLSLVLPRVYCGKLKTFALGIIDSSENRQFAEYKARQIEIDLMSGHFDPSLAKYKPAKIAPVVDLPSMTFSEIYQAYIENRKNLVSPATWKSTYINTLNHLSECPYKHTHEALKLKDWALTNRTIDATKRILMQLNAACNWAVERNLIESNPFLGKTQIKSKKSKPKIHPFSNAEKVAILDAFAESEKFVYLLPLIKFFFFTGCRTSEALGLRWKNVKTDCSAISFEEVVVLGKGGAQRKTGTKQSPQRDFPCNQQLQDLLRSIRPAKAIANASVFVRPNTSPISHQNLRTAWYGKGRELGIVRQLAAEGIIDSYRPQYNTRHTMISACLEAGINPIQIAQWVGNSAEIIFKNYAGIISKISVPEF
ncbi:MULTISPECIES: tyrosine-type recombinase/integrase [unclassified Microcoleus]|uniref:tyrosine-type recombinase/integrase n=1 Tax=unclassified Microcoleus TaxID=2642155 RepID=UPI002FD22302